jgi:hypothetical protein
MLRQHLRAQQEQQQRDSLLGWPYLLGDHGHDQTRTRPTQAQTITNMTAVVLDTPLMGLSLCAKTPSGA